MDKTRKTVRRKARSRGTLYVLCSFDQLDKLQFSIARSRIRSKLINGLLSLEHFTSGVDLIV